MVERQRFVCESSERVSRPFSVFTANADRVQVAWNSVSTNSSFPSVVFCPLFFHLFWV